MQSMRVMFTVQGDGRGHMTQALAMREMLARHGHEIVSVLAGQNQSRILPSFFRNGFEVPVGTFPSPGFSLRGGRSISTFGSVLHLVRHLRLYGGSLRAIRQAISDSKPDLIINFLEPLMGYYNLRRLTTVPTLSVAHHFMFEHPAFPRVKAPLVEWLGMLLYVRLCGASAYRLALSFYEAQDLPHKKLFVCPPILRHQLFQLRPDPDGRHLLAYLLNHGYEKEIEGWHRAHPDVPVHCFYDKPGAPPEERRDHNLTFHALDGEKYLRLMAAARCVVCTAGFESVSEAAYLGKPVLMTPVENHPEQSVNAQDAELAGIGTHISSFRLPPLPAPIPQAARDTFRKWVDQAESVVIRAVNCAFNRGAVENHRPAARRNVVPEQAAKAAASGG